MTSMNAFLLYAAMTCLCLTVLLVTLYRIIVAFRNRKDKLEAKDDLKKAVMVDHNLSAAKCAADKFRKL